MACQMVYHNGNCLNTKKTFVRSCRLCTDACPQQAISEFRRLNPDRCTECGVCMAVCPSDGFVDRMLDQFRDYLTEASEIVLNCPQAIAGGYEIPCLGMFDRDGWLLLLLQAEEKPVVIRTGDCGVCEDRQACAASVQTLKQIHAEWPEHGSVQIQVRPDQAGTGEDTREKGGESTAADKKKLATSRGKLRNWRKNSKNLIEKWLPSLTEEETYPLPKYREWLVEALADKADKKIPFRALTAGDSCTGCGVCVTTCPQEALQKQEDREPARNEDGVSTQEKSTAFRLILEPQKCVQCGRCVEICQSKALSLQTKSLSHRILTGKVLIHDGRPKYCVRCGSQVFDRNKDMCWTCAASEAAQQST